MNRQNSLFIGNTKVSFEENGVKGKQVKIGDESYYKISNVGEMRPFFMSIVSYSNHWMFLSSNGGLTAGRKNAQFALFPYYTDDKITEFSEITGSKTIFKVQIENKTYLWEPFSSRYEGAYKIKRNLFKNNYGNKVIFEEINEDLGLSFKYSWNSSEKYGFVKKSTVVNHSNSIKTIEVLDGLQNILPYGVGDGLQNASSNLVDAYKRSELNAEEGVGVFALSAIIVDKAEPSEALKANVVWSLGLENPTYLLSSLQLDNFRKGKELKQETDIKAEKGAYFIYKEFELKAETEMTWLTIADVAKSVSDVNKIRSSIQKEKNLAELVISDIEEGTKELVALTGNSDGIQLTADDLTNTRHFANTLFNIMRGGIFDDDYSIEKADFVPYIAKANKEVYNSKIDLLNELPEEFSLSLIKDLANHYKEDTDFKRLCLEYMPLKFSRRHGDPSRPWNKFSINTKSEIDGSKILDYEGNWRDIFQNWEALAISYPEFIESMIHKFLNATTFDGYNPYRVTKGGFDWETIEPDDPWSYIGYWGDHQIIYLLKFLEFSEKYYPNKLAELFTQNVFVYANVPYTIKSYSEILKNSKDTIDFNHEAQDFIEKERELIGADGALLKDQTNAIYKVNFVEKILATVLAKVSNFIPEGGIWMNTQRPEWNDANNALVGNGVSMVTLYYLRRFLTFFESVVENSSNEKLEISIELADFFKNVVDTLVQNEGILANEISDKERKTVLDGLGIAGSNFRETIYKEGFTGHKESISQKDLQAFIKITFKYINQTIEANKREDKLYHAYNLMTVKNDEVSITYLPEMLEGQVAVLSSGYVKGEEALELLDALKSSALFRPDQYSYILYPNKQLKGFNLKNIIPSDKVENSELFKQLIKDDNKLIIEKDVFGKYHFNGTFNNANSLKDALENLSDDYSSLVNEESEYLLEIFEEVFNHKAFTGRSGTFFGYEGLGSIYWHMVSKLLLSVQEVSLKAVEDKEDEVIIGHLLDHYYEIQAGIGVHKSPDLYGAFPTDPYSHTPGGKGAQQPGMTGQVKEDVICRFGELGVIVKDGKLNFNPRLLRNNEFLTEPSVFKYQTISKEQKELQIDEKTLCFTYCQVPIIYQISNEEGVEVDFGSEVKSFKNLELDKEISSKLFRRTGEIDKITVLLKSN